MLAQHWKVFLHPYFQPTHLFNCLSQRFQVGLSLTEILFEMKKLTLVVLDLLAEAVLQIKCSSHVLNISALKYCCTNVVLIHFLSSMRIQFLWVHDVTIYLQIFGPLHALSMMTFNVVYFFPVLLVYYGMVEYQSFLLRSCEPLDNGDVFLLICNCNSFLQPIELSPIHGDLLLYHLQD